MHFVTTRIAPSSRHALCLTAYALLLATPSWANTYTVNRTSDEALGTGGITCASAGAPCTLRAAIEAANANAGADTIEFAIAAGGGPATISPLSQLPLITGQVTINGYSQAGSSPNTLVVGNDAVINVRIDGANSQAGAGLVFGAQNGGASGSVLRGVAVTRFPHSGVAITGQSLPDTLMNVLVAGNFIGTDGTGTGGDENGLLANGFQGISIAGGAMQNTVGGNNPADRNLIVSNSNTAGIEIDGPATASTAVLNNYIGTNRAGTHLRATMEAIVVNGSSGNQIRGNVIGGIEFGIEMYRDVQNTTIVNNLIGVGTSGLPITGLAGSTHGILITDGAGATQGPQQTTIGGNEPSTEGNVIAFWNGNGVKILRGNASVAGLRRHLITGNSIHSNGGLGIELMDRAGVGAGPGSAPATINDGIAFPLMTNATISMAGTALAYVFNGEPDTPYRLEVFSNSACHASGYGEGETFVAGLDINTNVSGAFSGTATLPSLPPGSYLTMTASRVLGSDTGPQETSEFSRCIAVTQGSGEDAISRVPTLDYSVLALLSLALGGLGWRARSRR